MKNFFQIKNKVEPIIIGILIFGLLISLIPYALSVKATSNQATIDFLKNQIPDSWITMALVSAAETGLDLNHLKEVSGSLATDYEKTILALTALKENPRSFGSIDFVAQLKTFYQNSQIGSADLLNDDFWGILALVSSGESVSSQIIQDSKNFILTNQNEDGGWGYAVSGQSDTNDTAAAIMALLEVNVSSADLIITKAINYLQSTQNDDGGFPYLPGGDSDSGSDAWVISAIYKLGQDPNNWSKNNQNPINHLESLRRPEGSFKWIASEDKGYPVLTAYALIALNRNYYPINSQDYYPVNGLHSLRIEGENNNICNTEVEAITALDIVENGADICGFTYLIEESSWGPYLKKINNEEAHDLIGWLYFVNNELPSVGANDYALEAGDEVLWYFGDWGWKPARLILASQQVDPGDNLEAQVEYFENSQWNSLVDATIYVGNQDFITDVDGEADLVINNPGVYQVYAEKSGYIRTNQITLTVGEGVNQNVGLSVEIIQPSPEIAFVIDKSQIDFGTLSPGGQANDQLLIQNTGNVRIYLEGIVSGDNIFEDITLDGLNWSGFSTIVNTESEKTVLAGLTIPSDWTNFGVKGGNLTFWATAN